MDSVESMYVYVCNNYRRKGNEFKNIGGGRGESGGTKEIQCSCMNFSK